MEFLRKIARILIGDEIKEFEDTIYDLISKEIKKDKICKLKNYYNTKYPTHNLSYRKKVFDKEFKIDIRQFLNKNNYKLPKIDGTSDDEIALNSLKWIIKNIKYISDKKQYNLNEYWADSWEVLETKIDDCDGGAFLLYDIMRKNEIPAWKIRVTCGSINDNHISGGHCFIVYFIESEEKWVLLDWCFYPNTSVLSERKDYKNENYYKNAWFSFNEEHSWAKDVKDIPKMKNVYTN